MTTICIWPDGCWVYKDELRYMTHKSDDFTEIEVPDNTSELDIDAIVYAEVSA